ncbi:hypothetical protein GCM10009533_15540 [Saccharopolyspora spinosporotrichia]|uniref:Uncharacterized protein n=1 Tax=Saccharopolyspora erythraea TaxID=1836 RepID=A0ABN1CEW5_SACER
MPGASRWRVTESSLANERIVSQLTVMVAVLPGGNVVAPILELHVSSKSRRRGRHRGLRRCDGDRSGPITLSENPCPFNQAGGDRV